MVNIGLFAIYKIVSKYSERIYAYMERLKTENISVDNGPTCNFFQILTFCARWESISDESHTF